MVNHSVDKEVVMLSSWSSPAPCHSLVYSSGHSHSRYQSARQARRQCLSSTPHAKHKDIASEALRHVP